MALAGWPRHIGRLGPRRAVSKHRLKTGCKASKQEHVIDIDFYRLTRHAHRDVRVSFDKGDRKIFVD